MMMGLNIMRHWMRTVNVNSQVFLLTMSPECYNTIQETVLCAYSGEDASTIGTLPNFLFSLRAVMSLSSLCNASNPLSIHDPYPRRQRVGGSLKVNISSPSSRSKDQIRLRRRKAWLRVRRCPLSR
ncbi:hypothetical protein SCLCIDRAFT_290751 [Scleroderma citrinum Foug A]|uniref:Uncharacterized protein n=1 Tax=Scleroderma citrinum Foug A TaxID=1036808 RepID=A0A0C2ZSJ5_9AGAM|nr:hypothetical protein SCLCIDRAFT_290751 [Scleroderma citrinum Foug A]